MLYNDTVTVFNLHESTDGDIWYPTVISGVHVQVDTAANLTERGPEAADSVSLHIKFKKSGSDAVICNVLEYNASEDEDVETTSTSKTYLPPLKWNASDDKAGYVTFQKDKDFFYLGAWGSDPIGDLENAKSGFYNYMKLNEDDVYLITNVGKYNLLPHFEIGGR